MGVEIDDFDPFEGISEELEAEIREELHRSAEDMASIARATAPRDSGALANSIRVQEGAYRPDNPNVRGVSSDVQGGGLSVTVSAGDEEAFYAAFQEFGTEKMDANPFFFAAYDAVADAFEERMADLLGGAE